MVPWKWKLQYMTIYFTMPFFAIADLKNFTWSSVIQQIKKVLPNVHKYKAVCHDGRSHVWWINGLTDNRAFKFWCIEGTFNFDRIGQVRQIKQIWQWRLGNSVWISEKMNCLRNIPSLHHTCDWAAMCKDKTGYWTCSTIYINGRRHLPRLLLRMLATKNI